MLDDGQLLVASLLIESTTAQPIVCLIGEVCL